MGHPLPVDGLPGRAMKASVLHRGEAHQRLRLVQPEGAWNQAGLSPGGWCGQKAAGQRGQNGFPGHTRQAWGSDARCVASGAPESMCDGA